MKSQYFRSFDGQLWILALVLLLPISISAQEAARLDLSNAKSPLSSQTQQQVLNDLTDVRESIGGVSQILGNDEGSRQLLEDEFQKEIIRLQRQAVQQNQLPVQPPQPQDTGTLPIGPLPGVQLPSIPNPPQPNGPLPSGSLRIQTLPANSPYQPSPFQQQVLPRPSVAVLPQVPNVRIAESSTSPVQVLRMVSKELEQLAWKLEECGEYQEADAIRERAKGLRLKSRALRD